MNIQTVRDNLKNTIAGKEQLLNEWRGITIIDQSDVTARTLMEGVISTNIAELKRILQDVESCVAKDVEQSWRDNPDRSGGQFTQEEIDNANRW